jgi:hypothetical protein
MNDRKSGLVDSARRAAELREGKPKGVAAEAEEGLEFESDEGYQAFSFISADRQQKQMVEFRLLEGNAEALAYSYLVRAKYNPSEGIALDFSGYTVTIKGRNLRPGYNGLVAQRVAVVRQTDAFQAEANLAPDAAVITAIEIKEVE